jgi:hypothetical protein
VISVACNAAETLPTGSDLLASSSTSSNKPALAPPTPSLSTSVPSLWVSSVPFSPGLGFIWLDCAVSTFTLAGGHHLTICSLVLLGILTIPARTSSGAKWAQAVLMLIWVLIFDLSVGPLAYCIVGEV